MGERLTAPPVPLYLIPSGIRDSLRSMQVPTEQACQQIGPIWQKVADVITWRNQFVALSITVGCCMFFSGLLTCRIFLLDYVNLTKMWISLIIGTVIMIFKSWWVERILTYMKAANHARAYYHKGAPKCWAFWKPSG